MATRKAQDDPMARTYAEREIGMAMDEAELLSEDASPVESGRNLLGQIAKTVEFERGVSKDPDRNTVRMRRVVITGEWEIDPEPAPEA